MQDYICNICNIFSQFTDYIGLR